MDCIALLRDISGLNEQLSNDAKTAVGGAHMRIGLSRMILQGSAVACQGDSS
jgi:ABC-type transport system involved in cytochrome bd biosynthesis fused ATPase/permease subunit